MTPALLLNFLLDVTGIPGTGHQTDSDSDILFCFSPRTLSSKSNPSQVEEGDTQIQPSPHFCLLDCIDSAGSPGNADQDWSVRVVDPAPGISKWRSIKGTALLRGMLDLGDDWMGGIWLLSSRHPSTPVAHALPGGGHTASHVKLRTPLVVESDAQLRNSCSASACGISSRLSPFPVPLPRMHTGVLTNSRYPKQGQMYQITVWTCKSCHCGQRSGVGGSR